MMDEQQGGPPPPQQQQHMGGWEGQQGDGRNYQYPVVEEDGAPQISADLSDIAR